MKKVIHNVKFFWANVYQPDQYNNYSVKVFLSPEAEKELIDLKLGHKIKTDTPNEKGKVDCQGEKFIKLRRKSVNPDGTPNTPPIIVDSSKVQIKALIGNGSTGNILIDVYEYNRYGGGFAARLEKIQVKDLIPYEADEDFDEDDTSEDDAF